VTKAVGRASPTMPSANPIERDCWAEAAMRRNRAFTPRLPGDSATAERSARQHAHPTGVPPGQAMRFRCKA